MIRNGSIRRPLAMSLLLLVSACVSVPPPPAQFPKGAVDFAFTAYDGSRQAISRFRGKPLVVAVVATWAGPALIEVRRLHRLRETHGEAVEIVIIVLDEQTEMAAIFAETFEVPESVGRVENRAAFVGAGGPLGEIGLIPTSVLLDRQGKIAVRSDGPWPAGALEEAVETLLSSS